MNARGRLVSFRKVCADDSGVLLAWRNKDRVRLNMYNSEIIGEEEHFRWFASMLAEPARQFYIIQDAEDGKSIGVASLFGMDMRQKRAEWGFYIGEDSYLHKGYAVEAEFLVLRHVFEEIKLHRLSCTVLESNTQVISFHKRFGFAEEGRYRDYIFRDGRWMDVVLFSMTEDEYAGNRDRMLKQVDAATRRKLRGRENG
jgi:UDP-4-amino-4,6-dideoxy-N-acetyl-beta-L-altrosamine N-acetyltransferase